MSVSRKYVVRVFSTLHRCTKSTNLCRQSTDFSSKTSRTLSRPSSARILTRQCLPQLDQLPARFGLLDDTADHWSRFEHKIAKLNRDAPDGVSYKVFWIGRHGQGIREYLVKFHRELRTQSEGITDNVAKLKYGAEVRICRLCHVSCRLCAHRHGRSKFVTTLELLTSNAAFPENTQKSTEMTSMHGAQTHYSRRWARNRLSTRAGRG